MRSAFDDIDTVSECEIDDDDDKVYYPGCKERKLFNQPELNDYLARDFDLL